MANTLLANIVTVLGLVWAIAGVAANAMQFSNNEPWSIPFFLAAFAWMSVFFIMARLGARAERRRILRLLDKELVEKKKAYPEGAYFLGLYLALGLIEELD